MLLIILVFNLILLYLGHLTIIRKSLKNHKEKLQTKNKILLQLLILGPSSNSLVNVSQSCKSMKEY